MTKINHCTLNLYIENLKLKCSIKNYNDEEILIKINENQHQKQKTLHFKTILSMFV